MEGTHSIWSSTRWPSAHCVLDAQWCLGVGGWGQEEETWIRCHVGLLRLLVLPLTSCMALDELCNLFKSQPLYLENGCDCLPRRAIERSG